MYENYSRQALPSNEYRALLGSAVCVFNSNNSFIIENILSHDDDNKYSWYNLIDGPSGELALAIKETITKKTGTKIASLFNEVVGMRNRIFHSFQVTYKDEQVLATKKGNGEQFIITEVYLYDFIEKNEALSILLNDFRGD